MREGRERAAGDRPLGRGERREGEGRRRPAAWARRGERIDLGRRRLGRRLAFVRATSSEKSDAVSIRCGMECATRISFQSPGVRVEIDSGLVLPARRFRRYSARMSPANIQYIQTTTFAIFASENPEYPISTPQYRHPNEALQISLAISLLVEY